jgi:hypothetical protein
MVMFVTEPKPEKSGFSCSLVERRSSSHPGLSATQIVRATRSRSARGGGDMTGERWSTELRRWELRGGGVRCTICGGVHGGQIVVASACGL